MPARACSRLACVFVAIAFACPILGADAPSSNGEIEAISKPSQDVVLSFVRPGRVVEIKVKEGDHVQKGDLLAQQDDSEEIKALALYKSKAEDNTQVDAQKKIHDQSLQDYNNLKDLKDVGSRYERDHARLQADIDGAKIEIALKQQEQDRDQYEQNQAVVEKTKLYAPFAGTVEELLVHQGESVDTQNMKVMRLVNVDPMWVEVPVPFAQGEQLKDGDPAQVKLSNGKVVTGKVIHVASVAESASDTLRVRVEVPNPERRKLGERVGVSFSTTKVAAAGQP